MFFVVAVIFYDEIKIIKVRRRYLESISLAATVSHLVLHLTASTHNNVTVGLRHAWVQTQQITELILQMT